MDWLQGDVAVHFSTDLTRTFRWPKCSAGKKTVELLRN